MIRRFARPRSIIARPQRTSMKDLAEMGEVLVTYQGYRENTVCYSPITKSIDLATFFINDEVLVSYQGCGENKICHSPITKSE